MEVGFVKLLKHSPSFFLTDSTRSYSIVFASKSPFLQNVAMLYKLVLAYLLFMIRTLCLRHYGQTQTPSTNTRPNNPNTHTLPSIAIKINDDIPKILCMQCSAVYFIFNSLVYVHINYKIDKKTSVNPYLYFNLWTAHQVLEVDL